MRGNSMTYEVYHRGDFCGSFMTLTEAREYITEEVERYGEQVQLEEYEIREM
mgnify:CR=1 FL=1